MSIKVNCVLFFMYEYMGQSKSYSICQKFCTDNQFQIKFWLPTCSTMRILNLKVGTMPSKIREVFINNQSPPPLSSVLKNRAYFNRP